MLLDCNALAVGLKETPFANEQSARIAVITDSNVDYWKARRAGMWRERHEVEFGSIRRIDAGRCLR